MTPPRAGSTPTLVIFDCDGTLVDSQDAIFRAMATAFAGAGRAAPAAADVRRVVGLSLPEAMARLVPDGCGEDHAALAAHYRDAFTAQHTDGAPHGTLFPGAAEAVARLDARGYLLGIATGKSRRGLATTLAGHGLEHLFATVQTADDAPSKPHPAMVAQAIAATGARPETTVLIGDTAFDMAMALAAGAGALGVGWGYHPPEELRAAGAHRVVDSFDQVDDAVEALIALRRER